MTDWLVSVATRQNLGTGLEHTRLGRHFALANADMAECSARSGEGDEETRISDMRSEGMGVLSSWRYASV